ncbi:MAG TPA: serine/threonine-protein kinase [Candidatus Ozemobacteraceae bacterium]|nr:serine/threonine-protein kinase [Candidatus Ozemobacteraceae bacterium]
MDPFLGADEDRPMIRQVTCRSCGLTFEMLEQVASGKLFCPNCANEVEERGGEKVEAIGVYRLDKLLGQGGMGQVYSAIAPDGKRYALKVMIQESLESPELIERFDREMAIMAGLDHDNIVKVIDTGATSSFKFYVMELVEGTTLRQMIRGGIIPEDRIIDICLGILRGLGYAHAHGVVHRDIKPENILFDRQGVVKVTDFGLARKFASGSDQQSLTATNAFMGTENYMSPEQKVNPKAVTHKTDIYAAGVVFYEMLTGGLLPMGIFQPPSYYKPVHQYWDTLTFRMLDINPDMRPDNCEAVITELERFKGHRSSVAGRALGHVGDGTAPASPRRPVLTPDEQAFERFVEEENDRIRQRLQNMLDEATQKFNAGEYVAALPLFEASLSVVLDPDERANILEWMRLCRERIQAAKAAVTPSLLCPGCHKPFLWSAPQPIPDEFACPLCRCTLVYDSLRKQLRKREEKLRKTPSSSDNGGEPARTQGMRLSDLAYQAALLLLVSVALIDWSYPELFEGVVTWCCKNGLTGMTGMSVGQVIIVARFLMHLVVLIVVVRLAYILSGF